MSEFSSVNVGNLLQAFGEKAFDAAEQLKRDEQEAAEEAMRAAADRRLHVELAKQREQENEATKPREQSKETASSSAAAAGPGAQEPCGTAASEAFSSATAKTQAASRNVLRKKKKPKESIFDDFGKEHDDAPIQEIKDPNGMVIHRLNYKRYWQSDKDLKRWGESLGHFNRYEKLTLRVRDRWHEDLQGDRLDLKIKHNVLMRSRQENRIKHSSSASTALQLRELQRMISPKDKKKKGGGGGAGKSDMSFLKGFQGGAGPSRPEDDQASEEPLGDGVGGFKAQAMLQTGSGQADDLNVLSPTARSDAGASPPSSPGRMSRRRPSGESERPPELLPSESLSRERHHISKQSGTHVIPGMPKTLALLLFRNADRLHTGEPCFVKVWPPPGGLKELLVIAGEACRPLLIPPAVALYDTELKKVKFLDEVIPGGVYLLKGMETLDPPKLFFNHDTAKVPSLRHLTQNRNAVATELDTLEKISQLPSPASTMSHNLARGERQPTVDSPPWGSLGALRTSPRPRKWEVDEYLGMKLSWGGQGMPHRHQFYEDWIPVLQSPFNHTRQIDRSASSTF